MLRRLVLRPVVRRVSSAGLCILAFFSSPAQAQTARLELTAGIHRIEAEVAADQASRMQGLMGRREMADNQGMLFVFPQAERHCMWMRNTLLPLSVAFLDERGRIVNIEDMQPQTEDSHCAAAPAPFALEMKRGWFARKGIGPGQRLGGVDKASVHLR